jgi:hypothetical protein
MAELLDTKFFGSSEADLVFCAGHEFQKLPHAFEFSHRIVHEDERNDRRSYIFCVDHAAPHTLIDPAGI